MKKLRRTLTHHQAPILLAAFAGCELGGLGLAVWSQTTLGMSLVAMGMILLFLGISLDAVKSTKVSEQDERAVV